MIRGGMIIPLACSAVRSDGLTKKAGGLWPGFARRRMVDRRWSSWSSSSLDIVATRTSSPTRIVPDVSTSQLTLQSSHKLFTNPGRMHPALVFLHGTVRRCTNSVTSEGPIVTSRPTMSLTSFAAIPRNTRLRRNSPIEFSGSIVRAIPERVAVPLDAQALDEIGGCGPLLRGMRSLGDRIHAAANPNIFIKRVGIRSRPFDDETTSTQSTKITDRHRQRQPTPTLCTWAGQWCMTLGCVLLGGQYGVATVQNHRTDRRTVKRKGGKVLE